MSTPTIFRSRKYGLNLLKSFESMASPRADFTDILKAKLQPINEVMVGPPNVNSRPNDLRLQEAYLETGPVETPSLPSYVRANEPVGRQV